jgi:hypothetical protein
VDGGHDDILVFSRGEPAMDTCEVLKTSEIKEGKDRYPSRIVLRRVKEKTYATHIEVMPSVGEPYLILGRYFFSLAEAENDFRNRMKEIEGF